jgi:hypothetical protein
VGTCPLFPVGVQTVVGGEVAGGGLVGAVVGGDVAGGTVGVGDVPTGRVVVGVGAGVEPLLPAGTVGVTDEAPGCWGPAVTPGRCGPGPRTVVGSCPLRRGRCGGEATGGGEG